MTHLKSRRPRATIAAVAAALALTPSTATAATTWQPDNDAQFDYSVSQTGPSEISIRGVGIDPRLHIVVLPNYVDGSVKLLDETSGALIADIPFAGNSGLSAVAVDSYTHTAYVSGGGSNEKVGVIDEASRTVSAKISLHEPVSDLAVDPQTHTVYGTADSEIVAINETTRRIRRIPVSGHPVKLAVDAKTEQLYVATQSAGLLRIDANTGAVGCSAALTGGPASSVAVDPGTASVYVANDGPSASTMTVIRAATCTSKRTIRIERRNRSVGPTQLAVDTGTHTVYATALPGVHRLGNAGKVELIRPASGAVARTLHLVPDTYLAFAVAVDSHKHSAYVVTANSIDEIKRFAVAPNS